MKAELIPKLDKFKSKETKKNESTPKKFLFEVDSILDGPKELIQAIYLAFTTMVTFFKVSFLPEAFAFPAKKVAV
jgi:hypothetical protein